VATQIAEAYVQVIPTTNGISSAIGKEFTNAGTVASGAMGGALVGGLKKFIGPIAAIFATIELGDLFGQSIKQASNFQESVNAVKVTFGDLSDEILNYGKNSARTLGLDKNTFNEYAVAFSNWADTLAGNGKNSADIINDLMIRGSDFASVYNLEVADALRLFQAGLAGETEPLRRFGIDMTMASIEAYALANGIWDGEDAMVESEKVMARYGVIMEATNKTQGDFARTSDMLANATRITKETWQEFQMALGDLFLPTIQNIVIFIRDNVIPILNTFVYEVIPAVGAWWDEHISRHFDKFSKEHGPALAAAWNDVIMPAIQKFIDEVYPMVKEALEWIAKTTVDLVIPSLERMAAWFSDPNNRSTIEFFTTIAMSFVKTLGMIVVAIAAVGGAFVVLVVGAAETATKIADVFKSMAQSLERDLNAIIRVVNTVAREINKLVGANILSQTGYVDFGITHDYVRTNAAGRVPGLADGGTVVKSGATLVGENGPEILNLSKGSSVIPLDKGYGNTVVYNAAPNQSIDSERALFTAMRRAKVVAGW
jgi:hypothetical protein